MPVQAPQWSEYLCCPVCQNEFEVQKRPPVSLGCGHTICRTCLESLQRKVCPFDQTPISVDLETLPINTALLLLIGNGHVPDEYRKMPSLPPYQKPHYSKAIKCIEELALFLKPSQSAQLSRPMQRKLVTLVNCQLLEVEGRSRAARSARSLGERSVTELILQHQNPQQLSTNLWAAVRARGCQFLGPAMQEEVLRLVLLALEDGSALSRKVLVMFVVQRLEPQFPQASKTSIGHVVQLLYRASCFKVTKRDGDSSLMQLKEEFRTYETLRREHDTQIVQIATEAGLRIAPDQWSSLLYGDAAHKSHMQSIIDKLQTPQSFGQSVQELVIALQRTGDPGKLTCLRPQLDILTNIDPSTESDNPEWIDVVDSLQSAHAVVAGLINFCSLSGYRKTGQDGYTSHVTKYKTSMCRDLATHGSCPRGNNCTFAHSQQELDKYRKGMKRQLTVTRSRELQSETPSPVPSLKVSPVSPAHAPHGNKENTPVPGGAANKQVPIVEAPTVQVVQPKAAAAVMQAAPSAVPAVAQPLQVASLPRVPVETFHVTPLVDQNGSPMIDAATGQQLVATPMVAPQVFQTPVQIAGADGTLYAVQPGAPIQMATLQVAPAMMVAPPGQVQGVTQLAPQQVIAQNQQPAAQVQPPAQAASPAAATPSENRLRDIKHDLSPEIASKSLSALKDRKEKIMNELGHIVGENNANIIGDIVKQQAVVEDSMVFHEDENRSRRNSLHLQQSVHQQQPQQQQQQQKQPPPPQQQQNHHQMQNKQQMPGQQYQHPHQRQQPQKYQQPQQQLHPQQQENRPQQHSQLRASENSSFSMWTSKPLITMNSFLEQKQKRDIDEDVVEALPDGICVSKFGPISRQNRIAKTLAEPRAVTANLGQFTRPTHSLRQPLASASPLPDGLVIMQEPSSVLSYDPGWYTDYYPREGMDSIAIPHLTHPPMMPISPLPNPRDQNSRLSSQNLSMFAESARINKELSELQRRISNLGVNEAQAMKRDRLAFELRMIEGGIRERQNEIQQNQNAPPEQARYSYW